MKISNSIFNIIVIILLIASCDKNDGNGTIFVTVSHNGKTISQASLFLKQGRDTTSAIISTFEQEQSSDGNGHGTFYNLSPGTYTIFAKGVDEDLKIVSGRSIINIERRYRQNDYNVGIDMQ